MQSYEFRTIDDDWRGVWAARVSAKHANICEVISLMDGCFYTNHFMIEYDNGYRPTCKIEFRGNNNAIEKLTDGDVLVVSKNTNEYKIMDERTFTATYKKQGDNQ